MKQGGLDEQTAFRRMQKTASSHNKKLRDVAETIVMAAEVIYEPTNSQ